MTGQEGLPVAGRRGVQMLTIRHCSLWCAGQMCGGSSSVHSWMQPGASTVASSVDGAQAATGVESRQRVMGAA